MIAESPVKDMPEAMPQGDQANPARGLRAHALGLIGANLVAGSLFLWALPLLAPWTPGSGLALVAAATMVLGVALVVRAARMLAGDVKG